jgi:hypothetical protein
MLLKESKKIDNLEQTKLVPLLEPSPRKIQHIKYHSRFTRILIRKNEFLVFHVSYMHWLQPIKESKWQKQKNRFKVHDPAMWLWYTVIVH